MSVSYQTDLYPWQHWTPCSLVHYYQGLLGDSTAIITRNTNIQNRKSPQSTVSDNRKLIHHLTAQWIESSDWTDVECVTSVDGARD